MSIEAMKMALETLERLDRWLALRYGSELTPPEKDVVTALRQAIEQAEQHDELTAAYMSGLYDGKSEWVGLTEDEFESILARHNEAFPFAVYQEIEAKLKEKNT